MKPSQGLIDVMEPERDKLFEQNLGLLERIDMFEQMIHKAKQRYNENQEKIKQIDYILDTYAYKKEEPS